MEDKLKLMSNDKKEAALIMDSSFKYKLLI